MPLFIIVGALFAGLGMDAGIRKIVSWAEDGRPIAAFIFSALRSVSILYTISIAVDIVRVTYPPSRSESRGVGGARRRCALHHRQYDCVLALGGAVGRRSRSILRRALSLRIVIREHSARCRGVYRRLVSLAVAQRQGCSADHRDHRRRRRGRFGGGACAARDAGQSLRRVCRSSPPISR